MGSYAAVLNGITQNIQALILGSGNVLPQSTPSDQLGAPYTNTYGQPTQDIGKVVSVTPVVTAATYAVSKCMGGVMSFANILATTFSARLQSLTLKFKGSNQTVGFWVALFSAAPAGTFTDGNTAAIATADTALLLGMWHLTVPTSVLGTHTVFTLAGINAPLNGSSQSLFAVVVPDATTAALGSVSDMTLSIGTIWG